MLNLLLISFLSLITACELFVLDLTMRAWSFTDENKRRTLQVFLSAAIVISSELKLDCGSSIVDVVDSEVTLLKPSRMMRCSTSSSMWSDPHDSDEGGVYLIRVTFHPLPTGAP